MADGAEKVKQADRERYREEAVSLWKMLAAAGMDEDVAWNVYARTEKLIAVLKFRLDYETPGVFTKLPDASDPTRLVSDAAGLLSESAEEISLGRLVESIETLRKARNNLRSYLTDKRKSATKAKRRARSAPVRRRGSARK